MARRRHFLALCAVVLAAGMSACQYRPEAPRRLTPPPDAEPQSVQAMCWRRASEQVEREFARVDPDVGVGVGRVVPLSRDFQRFDAEKRRQILYERCLQQAGASGGTAPVTEGPPGS